MRTFASVLLAASFAIPHAAHAGCHDEPPHRDVYMWPGLTLGYAKDGVAQRGVFVGGELSLAVATLRDDCAPDFSFAWIGGYTDLLFSSSDNSFRASIGPELGWSMLGFDGGFAVKVAGGEVKPGFAVRPVLTLGLVQFYSRVERFDRVSVEAGILLKWPFKVSSKTLR